MTIGFGQAFQKGAALAAILLVFGTVSRAEVHVRPSYVNFGSLSVGSSSVSHSVSVTNESRHSTTISRVFASDAQFSISGPTLPITLKERQSLTVTVTFKPATAKAYSGTLEFTRSRGWPIWVNLSGTGSGTTAPPATPPPAQALAPTISLQPSSEKIAAGQTASFRVAASGTAPIAYQWMKNGAAIAGATSPSLAISGATSADNNAQFTVMVSNTAGRVTSNGALLTVTSSSLLLSASSSSLNFGNVNVSSSNSLSVTLTNAGNSSVTISNVIVSGAGFNATGVSSGLVLAPGQISTLTSSFSPSAAGSAKGSVSVVSNATNSPDSISLSGTGVAAATTHAVELSWTPSASSVVGYNTYSSQQSGGPYTKLTGTPLAGTSYKDSTVQAGKTYYFVLTSVNSSNVESAYSTEVSAQIP